MSHAAAEACTQAHSGWLQGVLTGIRRRDQLAAANGRALDGPAVRRAAAKPLAITYFT